MSESLPKEEQDDSGLRLTAVLIGLVVVLSMWSVWALFGVQWMHTRLSRPTSAASTASAVAVAELGQVGDLFGGINALFAAFTVLGVGVAAYLQNRALIESRQALKEARRSSAHQQFESNFFQMLQLTRDIASNVRAFSSGGWEGSRLLDSWARALARDAEKPQTDGSDDARSLLLNLAALYEQNVYLAYPSALGPYFRSLFQTFKLVDQVPDSVVPAKEKIRYSNIARGQISDGAVLLLAVNGISPRGEPFAAYIEQYGLLEHMHAEYRRAFRGALELIYQPHAFLGSAARAATPKRVMSSSILETRALVASVMEQRRALYRQSEPRTVYTAERPEARGQ